MQKASQTMELRKVFIFYHPSKFLQED